MADYEIDIYEFLSLSPRPIGPDQAVAIERAIGWPPSIYLTGETGDVQELRSVAFLDNLDAAETELALYRQSISGDPVSVKWGGTELDFDLKILDVRPDGPGAMRAIAGGLGGPNVPAPTLSKARLRCVWRVLPVPKPT